jgi:hypothetical protein
MSVDGTSGLPTPDSQFFFFLKKGELVSLRGDKGDEHEKRGTGISVQEVRVVVDGGEGVEVHSLCG